MSFIPKPVPPLRIASRMKGATLRLVAGVGSAVCLLALTATIGAVALIETKAGQAWLRDQTRASIDALLPRNFEPRIGHQRIWFDEDGIAVIMEDVSFVRHGGRPAFLSAERIDADIDIGNILFGRGVVESLTVSGLVVDEVELQQALGSLGTAQGDLSATLDGVDDALLGFAQRLESLGVELLGADGRVDGPTFRSGTFALALTEDDGFYRLAGNGRAFERDWSVEATLRGEDREAGEPILAAAARFGDPHAPLATVEMSAAREAASDAGRLQLGGAVHAGQAEIRLALARGDGDREIAIEALDLRGAEGPGLEAGGTIDMQDPARPVFALRGRPLLAGEPGGLLALRGRGDLAARELTLETLDYAAGEERLAGRGSVGFAKGPNIALSLAGSGLSSATIKGLWPPFAGPEARDWVMKNVAEAGRVETGTIEVHSTEESDVAPDGPIGPLRFAIDGRFAGATTKTLGDLPLATQVAGSLRAVNGRTDVQIDAATIDGFPEVSVLPTTLAFDVRRKPEGGYQTDGNLSLELSGPLADIVRIADMKPVSIVERAGRPLSVTGGHGEVSLGASFHLEKNQPPERVLRGYTAMFVVDDLAVADAVGKHDLTELDGLVTLSPGLIGGDLQGRVDGVPSRLTFSQPFGREPVGKEELNVTLTPEAADIRRFVPMPPDQFAGPVTAEITKRDGAMRAEIDLSRARIGLPWIGWSKGEGVAAKVAFDIREEGEKGTLLDELKLEGQGFGGRGSARIDADGLRALRLERLFLNEGDDASLVVQRARNGYAVQVGGSRLDLRPALARILRPGAGGGEGGASTKTALDLSLTIDEARGFGGSRLRDVVLNLSRAGERIVAARLDAIAENGQPVAAQLTPQGSASGVNIQAGDAGAVLRFLGLYDRMEGGSLAAQLSGSIENGFSGGWRLRNFALVDEPRLASLVGTPVAQDGRSLRDVVGPVSRALFDLAEGNVAYQGGRVRLSDGVIRGEVFGSSFEGVVDTKASVVDIAGSFMPAYSVNRVFGALPLVGGILGNGNEGGLIGITYRLAGSLDEPTLTVNPVSLIAPGIFRRIFAY